MPLQAIELRAPLARPRRGLLCVGRNYRAHAAELASTVFSGQQAAADGWPMVFTKFAQCVIGPHDDVRLPGAAVSSQIDYEGELVIVIGRGGRDITRARALDLVFGYTLCNDVTARDIQVRHGQWDLGKNLDTFCPLGPWVASADSFDASDARLRTWVNGELRQDARTADLIFDIPSLVETCSRGITLQTGDLIATGTPAGVGMGMAPPRWLASGDVVRVEVDGLGAIENRFA
ncbi:MAG: fumarylacetoacetate hydrolase family protein [Rubrivivax sp.]|nr:fumarylacetoacetate hydrolase family protein [Rubrivivax sp.]